MSTLTNTSLTGNAPLLSYSNKVPYPELNPQMVNPRVTVSLLLTSTWGSVAFFQTILWIFGSANLITIFTCKLYLQDCITSLQFQKWSYRLYSIFLMGPRVQSFLCQKFIYIYIVKLHSGIQILAWSFKKEDKKIFTLCIIYYLYSFTHRGPKIIKSVPKIK